LFYGRLITGHSEQADPSPSAQDDAWN